jgi:hypothetical protein
VEYFKLATDWCYCVSQFKYGLYYYKREDISVHFAEATESFRPLAGQDYPFAQSPCPLCFVNDRRVSYDND